MKHTATPTRRRVAPPRFRFQGATCAAPQSRAHTRRQLRAQAAALQRWGRAQSSVAAAQGTCYVGMGLWPLTHLQSFELITGPKHNAALMQVAGALLTVIGIILLLGSLQKSVSHTTTFLGAGIAGVLAVLATVFVAKGGMPAIYLWDAGLESGFVVWWTLARLYARRHKQAQEALPPADDIAYTTFLPPEQQNTLH